MTTLRLEGGANCHVFTNRDHDRGNEDIRVSDLRIDGNGRAQRRPAEGRSLSFACGVYMKRVRTATLHALRIEDIRQTGLHFNGCSDVSIDEYASEIAGWSGISTSGTDDIRITRATILWTGLDEMHSGIHLDGGFGAYVEATVAHCTGNAVMLDSTFSPQRNVVLDCTCTDAKRGLSLSGSAVHPLDGIAARGVYSHNREIGDSRLERIARRSAGLHGPGQRNAGSNSRAAPGHATASWRVVTSATRLSRYASSTPAATITSWPPSSRTPPTHRCHRRTARPIPMPRAVRCPGSPGAGPPARPRPSPGANRRCSRRSPRPQPRTTRMRR